MVINPVFFNIYVHSATALNKNFNLCAQSVAKLLINVFFMTMPFYYIEYLLPHLLIKKYTYINEELEVLVNTQEKENRQRIKNMIKIKVTTKTR